MAVLLLCLAGLTAGMPTRLSSASSVDEEQIKQTVTLIKDFIPPLIDAIKDESGDPDSRINKIVDTSLVLSEEALKLAKPSASNQEALEEVEAARETVPLIMDLVRATISAFDDRDSNFDGFGIPSGGFDFNLKTK